ncbi:MAG: hypothetical protein K2R98_29315 [Gemmataceae bacterium]|nr:hypothetical protein [Gemmataceae bacterium]
MYRPSLGVWLSDDPIGFEGGQQNLYEFVGNNPTNETDPSGLAVPRLVQPSMGWKPYQGASKTILYKQYRTDCPSDQGKFVMFEYTDKSRSLLFKVYCNKETIEGEIEKAGAKAAILFGECVEYAGVNAFVFRADEKGNITKISWYNIESTHTVLGQTFPQCRAPLLFGLLVKDVVELITKHIDNPEKAESELAKYIAESKYVQKDQKNFKPSFHLFKYPGGPLKPMK